MALEHNLDDYRRRLSRVPEQDVIPLSPEIAVPLLEKITYVTDSNLSQLYTALLAAASIRSSAELVHPSFVSVVNHLAPDEARLLESFGGPEFVIPTLSATWYCDTEKDTLFEAGNSVLISPSLSECLQFPHRLPAYVSNLAGLGLLAVELQQRLSQPVGAYDDLRSAWESKLQQSPHSSTRKLNFWEGNLTSSQFGEQFFEACHAVPSTEI